MMSRHKQSFITIYRTSGEQCMEAKKLCVQNKGGKGLFDTQERAVPPSALSKCFYSLMELQPVIRMAVKQMGKSSMELDIPNTCLIYYGSGTLKMQVIQGTSL